MEPATDKVKLYLIWDKTSKRYVGRGLSTSHVKGWATKGHARNAIAQQSPHRFDVVVVDNSARVLAHKQRYEIHTCVPMVVEREP